MQSQYHILNPSVPVPIMSGKYVAHAQSSFFHFGTVKIHIYIVWFASSCTISRIKKNSLQMIG